MAVEGSQKRLEGDMVFDKINHLSATGSIGINDHLVKVTATAASVVATLPSVAKAVGRRYVVYCEAVSGSYTVTVSDLSDDSGLSSIVMDNVGEGVILYSDGERWMIDGVLGGYVAKSRLFVDEFNGDPLIVQNDGSVASGVDTEVNVFTSGDSVLKWNLTNIATQTIIAPVHEAVGLDIGRDQTDNDGSILDLGINSGSAAAFTIGTDAFYARMKFSLSDVSGTDDCAFGFKIASARQAAIDNETDMAVLNVQAGAIFIETALNNAAVTATDTTDTWADAATHTLEVRVDSDGLATYLIDDVAPTVTAAFTFDDADVVVPFMYFIQATVAPGACVLQKFECGLQ